MKSHKERVQEQVKEEERSRIAKQILQLPVSGTLSGAPGASLIRLDAVLRVVNLKK